MPVWNRSQEEEGRGRALRAELLTQRQRSARTMATAMAASAAERAVLEEEFRWLLHAEVHAVLRQLQDILKEASLRFTLPGPSTEGPAKQENFILGSCGTDQVKGVLTLQGDALSQADVNLKMPRNNQLLHFAFREDKQWKLQQVRSTAQPGLRPQLRPPWRSLGLCDHSKRGRIGVEVPWDTRACSTL